MEDEEESGEKVIRRMRNRVGARVDVEDEEEDGGKAICRMRWGVGGG